MLDLFCGRLGWSKEFLANGWNVTAVDLVRPPSVPERCKFVQADVLGVNFNSGLLWKRRQTPVFELYGGPKGYEVLGPFDFICASSPCEEFSVHGMKNFHPNPKYPEMGIKLFNHTRAICEESGVPFVMENVRAAQQFVGKAMHHCGSFYLWGNGVPAILPQGITKGFKRVEMFAHDRTNRASVSATIPPELASCVADYAERICAKACCPGQ